MPDEHAPPSLESLLEHRDWLRTIARAIVDDSGRADDIEQEVWLAALKRPPTGGVSPRAWLSGVVRRQAARLWRSNARTTRRERAAARPEALPSTVETVAAAEACERVVRAVLDLDEPYRSTLLLRFLEGLSPAETAARLGVEPSTVRGRQSRAIAMLRARFDTDGGREGRDRAVLLAPLVIDVPGPATSAEMCPRPWAKEMLILTKAQKVAAAVAAAVLLATISVVVVNQWSRQGDPAGFAPLPAVDPAGEHTESVRRPRAAIDPDASDASAPPTPAPAATAETAPAARTPSRTLRVAFVDGTTGAPISAQDLLARYAVRGGLPVVRTRPARRASEDGAAARLAEMVAGAPAGWTDAALETTAEGFIVRPDPSVGDEELDVVVLDPHGVPRLAKPTGAVVTLRVRGGESLTRVRVIDAETGEALRDAFVQAQSADAGPLGPSISVGTAGEIELPLRDSEDPRPTFWIRSATHAGRVPDDVDRSAVTVDAPIHRAASVSGTAYLPDGAPAPGRPVFAVLLGRSFTTVTDRDGLFRLDGLPVERAKPTLGQIALVRDVAGFQVTTAGVILRPGTTTKRDVGEARSSAPTATIRGTLKIGGRAAPGAAVILDGPSSQHAVTTTGSDGGFVHDGLAPGGYVVMVVIGDVTRSPVPVLRSIVSIGLAAGEERALSFDLPSGAIRVRVLDGGGRPASGVEVTVSADDEDDTRFPGFTYASSAGGRTDRDGVVVLRGLDPARSHTVSAGDGEPTADGVTPGPDDTPAELTLRDAAR